MRLIIAMAMASCAAPAFAQHDGHGGHQANQGHESHEGHAAADPVQPEKPDDHDGMDHGQMDHGAMDHGATDHADMDHAKMDHSTMNHGAMGHATEAEEAAPPSAGSGPPRAADAIWGAEAMRESRAALARENGGMTLFWLQADRLEYRVREGEDGFLWDAQAWYGGDIDKLWLKSEGEGAFGEGVEDAEVQALWSHAIGPWFDLQAGVRQDLTGPTRTHAVVGVQGLAPYLFEVDAAAFLSDQGDVTARIEAELDQRITQRLVLQPRVELGLSAQDIPELGVGAGLDHVEAGLRLRYEIVPEFAPYIGLEQEWKLGGSADYARAAGEDTSVTSLVLGVRFWF